MFNRERILFWPFFEVSRVVFSWSSLLSSMAVYFEVSTDWRTGWYFVSISCGKSVALVITSIRSCRGTCSICMVECFEFLFAFAKVSEFVSICSNYLKAKWLVLLIRISESCVPVCSLGNRRCNSHRQRVGVARCRLSWFSKAFQLLCENRVVTFDRHIPFGHPPLIRWMQTISKYSAIDF